MKLLNSNRERRSRSELVSRSTDATRAIRKHKPDYWLLILTSLLLVIGVVVVYSISPGLAASQGVSQGYFITKQIVDVVLAVAAFAIASYLPLSWWQRSAKGLVIISLVAAGIVMLLPVDSVYQAHRWIRVGGVSFQVVELMKLALIVWLAKFLTAQAKLGVVNDFKETFRPLIAVTIGLGFIVAKLQSDLGSTAVMVAIIGLMAFVSGISLKKIGLIAGLIIILGVLAISSSSYRRDRLATFLNPGRDCQSTGYQACQALISVGSGGLFGVGLGYSVQAYGYTPEASDDSIFAIMGEQFGFVGSVIIIGIYGAFIARMKGIVERSADMFSRLFVVGVMAWLSTQMIINIGAMIGLLPLKGITLPLISQGGTSLIFVTAALGVVFQISRYTSYSKIERTQDQNESKHQYYSTHRRRVGGAHHASSGAGR